MSWGHVKLHQGNYSGPLDLLDPLNVLSCDYEKYSNNQFFLCEYHHSPHTRYSCTFWRSYVNQVVSSSNHTVSKDILTTLLLELFKWGIIPITTTVSFDITKLANSIKVSSYVNHRFVYKLAYSWMGTQKNLSKWYNITTYL